MRAAEPWTRTTLRAAPGVLLITRAPLAAAAPVPGQPVFVASQPTEGPEVLLALWDDGSATAFCGHVDLGTGLRTALAQLVADELDLPLDRLVMRLGDTDAAPNQGATIASASIQIHAMPLRRAAALARAWLKNEAGALLARSPVDLLTTEGRLHAAGDGAPFMRYDEVLRDRLGGRQLTLSLDNLNADDPAVAPLKTAVEHRLIGQPIPRLDIPAKADGELVFVHDMRLPGMLHGRVVRPPYAGVDAGDFVGTSLISANEASIAHLPGIVAVVVQGDFIGIVAEREDQAEAAQHALQPHWKASTPTLPPLDDLARALREHPATERVLHDDGQVDAALDRAPHRLQREYVWPYQLHASIGPSCAVAQWHGQEADPANQANEATPALTVWAGTQNPHALRADIARLTGLQDPQVSIVRMEAAGCYGRNGADDVAADAALLSRATGRPVRVQLTREQEHLWEPKGAAQLMQIDGAIGTDGTPLAYHFRTAYPSNGAPTLALLLTRTIAPDAQAYQMGDRTARPPYDYPVQKLVARDMPPILRASWLRGVSALPNSFAHESYIDELAHAAGADPLAYRLKYLSDTRASDLLQATAARAGWLPHTQPQQQPPQGDWLQGQGVAYARYVHSKWPGFGAAWAAWVADVEVHRLTGEVNVKRVVVGHDAGLMVNPAGVQQQVHGNVLQTTSRALKERLPINPQTQLPAAREWGSYPILNFRDVPVVDVLLMPRPGEPPLGAGESSSVPGTAAIANAIFDATGLRLRQPPFTPEVVRAAMAGASAAGGAAPGPAGPGHVPPAPLATPPALPTDPTGHPTPAPAALPATARPPRRRAWWARGLALTGGLLAAAAGLLGWRPAIAPVTLTPTGTAGAAHSLYTAETIQRGRVLAALGNCATCHTAESPGALPNAGGRWIETPFGRIATTNLTPDPETGLGRWSFSAFQRAMREGISRDGRHLYPAFPYTAFAKTTDDDLQALYAWLMSQPAVRQATPPPELRFPFNIRPLMALWNPLFNDPAPYTPDPTQTAQWNRGAYLVNGLGHCGACHTERNALGAERSGNEHFLGGAMVDGWEAPALTARSAAPVPWNEQAFYDYLRRGYSREHGVATGPMVPVIQQLQVVPDADIRAMAVYLASFNPTPGPGVATVAEVLARARERAAAQLPSEGQRLFEQACGACHHDGDGPQTLGLNIPLVLGTKVHSGNATNLERVIREGIAHPVHREVGFMGGFGRALDEGQVREITRYLLSRR